MSNNRKSPLLKNMNQNMKEEKVDIKEYQLTSGEKRVMQDYKSNAPLYDSGKPVKWSFCEYFLLFGSWIICLIPIFWFFIPQTVRDYERALIFRLGKLRNGAEGPGVFLINPLTDMIKKVELRIVTHNLPPQSMMTKDAVTVTVDAIAFMRVTDPVKCILEVDDYVYAFSNFAATTLRYVYIIFVILLQSYCTSTQIKYSYYI